MEDSPHALDMGTVPHALMLAAKHRLVGVSRRVAVGVHILERVDLVVTLLTVGSTDFEVGQPVIVVFEERLLGEPPTC